MPFRNLSDDKTLDWLEAGIAESMLSDLKKAGRTVVEREQLDRALAEIALQQGNLSEDSQAARAGRLVGAHKVVLGGYQVAGGDLRITARVVVVETGVVQETAKVTGPLRNVFALQDDIARRLLGVKPKRRAEQPSTQTVKAYESWSRSRQTSSETEKVRYLREALGAEPSFSYALDDLAALEQRLDRYRDRRGALVDDQARRLAALLADPATPDDIKTQRSVQIMTSLQAEARYQALVEVATVVLQSKPLPTSLLDVRELASLNRVNALVQLRRHDEALRLGERHLNEFPSGMYAGAVDSQVRSLVDARRAVERGKAELAAELMEIDKQAPKPADPSAQAAVRRSTAWRRCAAAHTKRQYADALALCEALIAAERGVPDDDDLVKMGRWLRAQALVELGRFDEAEAEAKSLLDEDEAWARNFGVPLLLRLWPKP